MSEGVFRSIVSKPPYRALIKEVDSCGTAAYHVGDEPDSRTMSTLEDHGIRDYEHFGRQVHRLPSHPRSYITSSDIVLKV
jgi:low molecular weight phosphotyrosine protein phosphatase